MQGAQAQSLVKELDPTCILMVMVLAGLAFLGLYIAIFTWFFLYSLLAALGTCVSSHVSLLSFLA